MKERGQGNLDAEFTLHCVEQPNRQQRMPRRIRRSRRGCRRLPEKVLSLATDSSSRSLYAATGDGLWVHRLQSFPAPPVYHDAALYLRWLGIGAVGLGATVLAVLALSIALPRRREPRE